MGNTIASMFVDDQLQKVSDLFQEDNTTSVKEIIPSTKKTKEGTLTSLYNSIFEPRPDVDKLKQKYTKQANEIRTKYKRNK